MKGSISLSSSIFLLPTLLLLLLLPLIQCGDLIDRTCKKTPCYDLCVKSLRSNLQSSASNANVQGLAYIMANITLSNATDALNYIHGLLNQNTDPGLERLLAFCAETYIPVVQYILPQAIDALTNGHYGFANYGMSDAAKEVDACESKFSGSIKSPLTYRNNLMQNLCDITVAIIRILLKS